MLESVRNNRIQYQKLTEEEKRDRHILGTLVGPMADVENPTRNGRLYSEKLWEKVFDSPLVKEQFKAGGIWGELEHPADRDNVDPEKIAVCMPEPPKKGNDGLLYGYWHILNTPCGQILKTLVDYGYKPGISTRGNGDIIEDYNGEESVDPDTYQLNALDIVLIPAVEKARLDLVESVQNKKSLKESLKELVNNSDDNAKKIMNESLAQLNITLTSENAGEAKEVSIPVEVETDEDGNITISETEDIAKDGEVVPEVTIDAAVVNNAQSEVEAQVENEESAGEVSVDNIEADDEEDSVGDTEVSVITDLQESLKENSSLKQANESLQNSLSVSIAKEQQLNEELSRCKKKIAELVESQKRIVGLTARANKFENDNTQLSESLDNANLKTAKLSRTVRLQTVNINQLENAAKRSEVINNRKIESLSKELDNSKQETQRLKEEYKKQISEKESKIISLTENIDTQTQDFKSKSDSLIEENKQLSDKLAKVTEAYLKLKCQIAGIDYNRIKNNNEYNSVEDINRLTESYVSRRLAENALPFARQDIKKVKYSRPNESYSNPYNPDDIAYIDRSMSEDY